MGGFSQKFFFSRTSAIPRAHIAFCASFFPHSADSKILLSSTEHTQVLIGWLCPSLDLCLSTRGYLMPLCSASDSRQNCICILCSLLKRASIPKLMIVENVELILQTVLNIFSHDCEPNSQGRKHSLSNSRRVMMNVINEWAFISTHMYALRVIKLLPSVYLGLRSSHLRQ